MTEFGWWDAMRRIGRARIRDIPASCWCEWEYGTHSKSYTRISTDGGCPWHGGGK